ncbi:MAG: anhydro-N-acetylmuramic acid kinase [Bacteroidetes bacterium HGW-Bacteroidetes-17]|jgi:anhydro-N-acetylmuramic acid kinase|nr:MAG: anhydro-N-acetylmuramic acid kinase [Bacteroidetes bacterium HGW-Bacteroidetes-17]
MKQYNVIGLMSGTSLDGLDIASCSFIEEAGNWEFKIQQAETISYTNEWIKNLTVAPFLSSDELRQLDFSYGNYLAVKTLTFIEKNKLNPDFIASHGHTIFHQPEKNFTLQIGNGTQMAEILKLPVIYDFRALDISLGGQGAPLVPIGDQLLFKDFEICLNLGGFANISFDLQGRRMAQDVCPVNMALNFISQKEHQEYDHNGQMALKGKINSELLKTLNNISYYHIDPPKSLSREWFESEFLSILLKFPISNYDLLHTITEHIAFQISNSFRIKEKGKVLITGGGAHNAYLMQRIQALTNLNIEIPDHDLVDFKEAVVFAFLGILRMRDEVNCLGSATGAKHDSCGGIIANPKKIA